MTAGDLLTDIDLRYRNSFTAPQKCVWMNDEQNEIFNMFKIEAAPVTIQLVADSRFYLKPLEIKYLDQIKTATIQINNQTTPTFIELPFVSNNDNEVADNGYWYTFVGPDKIFINIPEAQDVAGYNVHFFIDSYAAAIVTSTDEVAVPDRYIEILKLGVLKRIAAARKDIVMQNNYDAERANIIADVSWTAMIQEPEWVQPADTLPRSGRNRMHSYRRWE